MTKQISLHIYKSKAVQSSPVTSASVLNDTVMLIIMNRESDIFVLFTELLESSPMFYIFTVHFDEMHK